MHSLRVVFQRNTCLRHFHKCVSHKQSQAALAHEEPEKLTVPVPEGAPKTYSPKINKLAEDITSLNLVEVAELSDLLKTRLNLPDAPIMPVGNIVAKVEEEEKPAAPVNKLLTVKMTGFDDTKKVALIKEIKNIIPGLNLVQAKKFIESAPQVIKSDLTKEEAEELKKVLSNVGAVLTVE